MALEHNPYWYPNNDNNKALLDFILWFSRYEYALKNTEFHKNFHGFLAPDWVKLKTFLKSNSVPTSLCDAMYYLQKTPPNKQTIENEWKPVEGKNDWPFLIDCLLTIRNNIFHGGKHYPGELLSPSRDINLIHHCLNIMRELHEVVPEHVQIVFDTV